MGRRSDLPIQEKLARIDQWRASGMKLKEYLTPLGEDLGMWVAWLRWERRWRGLDGARIKPKSDKGNSFVRAVPVVVAAAKPGASIEMVLHGSAAMGSRVQVCWPAGQEQASARWLREVLK